MPANVVKPGQENEWERAKKIVHKNYPKLTEKNKRFWKIVMTVFRNMVGKPKTQIEKAAKK